jgi:glycosidase
MSTRANDAFFYHVYPLGMCGAPERNDFASAPEPRLAQLHGWIPHLRELGVDAVYLGPLFESTAHGYDTADYYRVDRRLGDSGTLGDLTTALRARGIRVILDGVLHHVGRDFWAFRDLLEKREGSAYRDWFAGVDFGRRSPAGDPFAYEGWRGHHGLVKLNLRNPAVREHLFGAVRTWVEAWGIDGLRLDVAEDIDPDFLRELARFCRALRADFWLLGEAIHGDYRRLATGSMLDSATNYELYKGLYSSHNDRNYFELAFSLNRQFGEGGIYAGLPLYNFADNHDVTRVASTLREPAHLYPLHALLFTVPGVPSVYYGSEWGIAGTKRNGDDRPLRPHLRLPDARRAAPHPDLAAAIARFARIRAGSRALRRGSYRQLHVAPEQLAFARQLEGETVVVAVNAAAAPATVDLPAPVRDGATLTDLLSPADRATAAGGRLRVEVPPRWARILATR